MNSNRNYKRGKYLIYLTKDLELTLQNNRELESGSLN